MSYLNVPTSVAVCPYCGSGLCVEPMGFWLGTHLIADATVWCIADLEALDQSLVDDEEDYYDDHPCGYDPDWMQASIKAEAWAQTQPFPESDAS